MIKHRFYNAVDFSVRHWTLILHKNTLINATQNLIGKITLKPTQITLWLCFLDQCCPIVTSCIKKYSLTSSFYSELQNILNSSSNWNVQIWIFKTPFYPLYTCSLIKYSTLSHYCIRKSKDGRHNRTIVIHNPLSATDKDKRWILSVIYKPRDWTLLLYEVARLRLASLYNNKALSLGL